MPFKKNNRKRRKMAKESMKARQRKRERMGSALCRKKSCLKAAGDWEGLQKLPKNASPVRLRNRCNITGRPRGYMRDFGICRNVFREMASDGLIPGITKASW